MDYKKFIDIFSKSIFDLSSEESRLPITIETRDNLSVYKVNLLYGLKERLENDFPKAYLYLEDNNFTFLVRSFIRNTAFKSANYFDVAREFLEFIKNSSEIHQDEYVYYLGIVDSFWSFGFCADDRIPKGILELWLSFDNDLEEEIIVKMDEFYRLSAINDVDETSFSLVKDTL
jgi:hypothetical protein